MTQAQAQQENTAALVDELLKASLLLIGADEPLPFRFVLLDACGRQGSGQIASDASGRVYVEVLENAEFDGVVIGALSAGKHDIPLRVEMKEVTAA